MYAVLGRRGKILKSLRGQILIIQRGKRKNSAVKRRNAVNKRIAQKDEAIKERKKNSSAVQNRRTEIKVQEWTILQMKKINLTRRK